MEDLTIRHRNRLRHHYTQTSNVLLFGYQGVSDGAKLTYQVIDSFDWSNAAGVRKGFAHPSLRRLAEIRGVEKRSIRRHLAELERARLITRQERTGRPSILVIEDSSTEETDLYLRTFAGSGEDRIVLPTPDKIVRPYKKDEEPEERQNLVNEEQALSEVGESGDQSHGAPQSLENRMPRRVVPRAKREYLAGEMLALLKDAHSLGYYRKVAETVEPTHIFEALSIVKQLSREGKIRKNRGAMFVSLLRAMR
jgi:DNA-binding MarR family transcriptional regulator